MKDAPTILAVLGILFGVGGIIKATWPLTAVGLIFVAVAVLITVNK